VTSLSVALCTYNGAPFLAEQLDSLAAQTQLPDELVVCDDGSTDETVALLDDFAGRAPFPVRIHRNPARLGVAANFSQALTMCSGAMVALCDQDDVWMPERLERAVRLLDARPSVGAVFSDAALVDERVQPLGKSLFQATGFTPARRSRFGQGHELEVLLARPVVCGATMTLRAAYFGFLLPIPPTGLHDLWLSTLLSAVTTLVAIDEPLIRYRQHGSNQIGHPARGLRAKLAQRRTTGVFGDELAHYRAMAERLGNDPGAAGFDQAIDLLRQKVAHLEFRREVTKGDAIRVLKELTSGRYHRYSRGVESAGYDLVFGRGGKGATG
jgi:glycosyltransferase involved in cell wall biosynthesis